MKKYQAELAIFDETGAIIGWDFDSIQDYIEAENAEEAIYQAKEYIRDCIVDNGGDPETEHTEVRVREVIDAAYGDYGEWIYE